jgi:regulatory protein
MHAQSRRRTPRPLTSETLNELALFYVGRYATTRAKLAAYLRRKVRERGWEGANSPDIDRLVERLAASGLVDDATYALSKSRSLSERGYGAARVRQALRAAGIADADGEEARELADEAAAEAALRFARRKRLGPFASERPDRKGREKAIAAMIRAGHRLEIARILIESEPGIEPNLSELRGISG